MDGCLQVDIIVKLTEADQRDMDDELTMTTSESPMETASPRDVDISDEVLELRECSM